MTFALLLLACLLTCAGQIARNTPLKAGAAPSRGSRRKLRSPWLWLALLCLGFGLLVWLLVLQRLEVGVAYPMLSLNFVLITLVARYLFKEHIDRRHWLGVGLVIAGVVLFGAAHMSLRRGFAFASASVLLVSTAQLGMRWSMTRLPEPAQWLSAINQGEVSLPALGVVSAADHGLRPVHAVLAAGSAGLAAGPRLFAVKHQLRIGVPAGREPADIP